MSNVLDPDQAGHFVSPDLFPRVYNIEFYLISSIARIYRKIFLLNHFRVSNVLDPDQARHFVSPDLGPNCLQQKFISRWQKLPLARKEFGLKRP